MVSWVSPPPLLPLGSSSFSTSGFKNSIYPIILGDSIKYIDLKIEQLNTNRYSYLNNEFPLEAILVYSGKEKSDSQFVIYNGNTVVYRESIVFDENDNTRLISLTLPASKVGIQKYTVQLLPLTDEKNTSNNKKQFAVEVIDQATNVLIISEIVHPDLGMLKRAMVRQKCQLRNRPEQPAPPTPSASLTRRGAGWAHQNMQPRRQRSWADRSPHPRLRSPALRFRFSEAQKRRSQLRPVDVR